MERIQELLTSTAAVDGDYLNMKTGTQVFSGIAFMFVDLVCGIDAIEAERDSANRTAGSSNLSCCSTVVPPPATPWFLRDLSNRDFSILLHQHRQRLQQSKTRVQIDQLEDLFDDFKQPPPFRLLTTKKKRRHSTKLGQCLITSSTHSRIFLVGSELCSLEPQQSSRISP
jgi:hypothetical protein